MGSAVILAAETLETRSIAAWLSAFTATHNRYCQAQDEVVAREQLVVQAKRALEGCNAGLDTSLNRLAAALMLNGQPRVNPFRGYKTPSPAVLERRAVGAKAAIAQRLADSVSQRGTASADVRTAAVAVRAAAVAVEHAIDAVNRALAHLATARLERDALDRQWDADLSALRHAAAASADLHLAQWLFSGIRRPKKSPRKTAPSE